MHVDSIPGLLSLPTPTGEVECVNPQLEEYCGRTLEELHRWDTSDTVHPDDPHIVQLFMKSIITGVPCDFETHIRRFDGGNSSMVRAAQRYRREKARRGSAQAERSLSRRSPKTQSYRQLESSRLTAHILAKNARPLRRFTKTRLGHILCVQHEDSRENRQCAVLSIKKGDARGYVQIDGVLLLLFHVGNLSSATLRKHWRAASAPAVRMAASTRCTKSAAPARSSWR